MANDCLNSLTITSNDPSKLEIMKDPETLNKVGYDFEIIRESENEIVYSFYSAWEPPLEELTELSNLHPNLHFDTYFEEPNMEIYGDAVISKGECNVQYMEDKEIWKYKIKEAIENDWNGQEEIVEYCLGGLLDELTKDELILLIKDILSHKEVHSETVELILNNYKDYVA